MMSGTSTTLSFESLSSKLIEDFPELRDRYDKELEWWRPEKPGQHIVYGDIFTPYLVELLESGSDIRRIRRAFDLIESLIADDDIRVQEVAVVTVLEYLQGRPELLSLAEPYMGPLARQAVRDLSEFWQRKEEQNQ